MKFFAHFFLIFLFISACSSPDLSKVKEGDLIFHISRSSQSRAIQYATHSEYSHLGIILFNDEKPYVLEATQPVKKTPLKEFISKGEKRHFVIKRLREKELDSQSIQKMKQLGERYLGKPYDLYFEWSDDHFYCSELVWKIYKRIMNIEIGSLREMRDFDLSNPLVQKKLKERFGSEIPLSEKVISPAEMFNSSLLEEVIRN